MKGKRNSLEDLMQRTLDALKTKNLNCTFFPNTLYAGLNRSSSLKHHLVPNTDDCILNLCVHSLCLFCTENLKIPTKHEIFFTPSKIKTKQITK